MSPDPLALESLLAFWTDGGVDMMYADAPVNRTLAPRPPPAATAGRAAGGGPATAVKTPPRPPQTREPPAVPDETAGVAAAIGEARARAAQAHDLEALAAAIAAFDGCALKGGARQAVFSRGRADAPLMAIGEAPGADEDAQGAPFVGRAGQMLDRMLAAAGLADRVFITNTVFWRPPGNRTPTPVEQSICAPFLERAIALVKPRALLLVGGASAKAVLARSEGILSLRGRWFEWKSADGALEIPALPTLHPAFLLRQPAAKRKSWEDLLIMAERLDRPHRPT